MRVAPGWRVAAVGRTRSPYPADVVTLPFVVDMAGNALDLYDWVDGFDDACHFLSWLFLGAALGRALMRTQLGPWPIPGLCVARSGPGPTATSATGPLTVPLAVLRP